MKKLQSYDEFLNEAVAISGEIFKPKRNKPVKFDHTKHPELAAELFDLIQIAYSPLGGHLKVKTPDDVFKDPNWNFWEGVDIHGTDDFDIIMFGKKTKYGIKFAGVGHDGSKDAKRSYIGSRIKDLKKPGHYIEVSGKIAEILIKNDVPVVTDEAEIQKVVGKKIEFNGEHPNDSNALGKGWYSRKIGGGMHVKILVGKPKL